MTAEFRETVQRTLSKKPCFHEYSLQASPIPAYRLLAGQAQTSTTAYIHHLASHSR